MSISFKLYIYCKSCDRGDSILICANSRKDVNNMTTSCRYCKNNILLGMFLFDDLKATIALKKESMVNKLLSNDLTEDEFWEIMNEFDSASYISSSDSSM